jgi:hypothetical protein
LRTRASSTSAPRPCAVFIFGYGAGDAW